MKPLLVLLIVVLCGITTTFPSHAGGDVAYASTEPLMAGETGNG